MGKGDKKTAKGKRIQGSYGITRKRKKVASVPKTSPKSEDKNAVETEVKPKKAPAAKKTTEKKAVAEKKTTAKAPAAKKTTKKATEE